MDDTNQKKPGDALIISIIIVSAMFAVGLIIVVIPWSNKIIDSIGYVLISLATLCTVKKGWVILDPDTGASILFLGRIMCDIDEGPYFIAWPFFSAKKGPIDEIREMFPAEEHLIFSGTKEPHGPFEEIPEGMKPTMRITTGSLTSMPKKIRDDFETNHKIFAVDNTDSSLDHRITVEVVYQLVYKVTHMGTYLFYAGGREQVREKLATMVENTIAEIFGQITPELINTYRQIVNALILMTIKDKIEGLGIEIIIERSFLKKVNLTHGVNRAMQELVTATYQRKSEKEEAETIYAKEMAREKAEVESIKLKSDLITNNPAALILAMLESNEEEMEAATRNGGKVLYTKGGGDALNGKITELAAIMETARSFVNEEGGK